MTLHWHGRTAMFNKLRAAYNAHTFPGTEWPEHEEFRVENCCKTGGICKPYAQKLYTRVPR